jgi:hypothetical protein
MRIRAMALLCIALAGGAASLPGQQGGRRVRVQGSRSLSLGTLLPGIPHLISRTDPLRSGQFTFTGARLSQVQLTLALPTALSGPAGATLPVSFGGNDAGYSASQSITSQIGFDPRAPFLATLSNNGRGSVFLGGTAQPLTSQRPGSYSGTVTLTVVYFP